MKPPNVYVSKMSQNVPNVPNVPPDVNDTNDTFSMSQMSHSEQMSKMSVNGTALRVLYGHVLPPTCAKGEYRNGRRKNER